MGEGGAPTGAGTTGRAVADLLTASRAVVAALLVVGQPPATTIWLVAWSWASDAADGPLARRAGRPGRLARHDRVVDAAVATALLWHLAAIGAVPAVPTRATTAALLATWAATRVLAPQMLLQALAGGTAVAWGLDAAPAVGLVLPALAVSLAAIEWRRLVGDLVPRFLSGWATVLTGRAIRWRRGGSPGGPAPPRSP